MTTENRERFLRINPWRTEKAVKAILTLAKTGNAKTYEYTAEEAQACFAAIEEAARELYEAFGLGGGTELPEDTLKDSSLNACLTSAPTGQI